ncbi:MAG: flagellar motor switch protein FliM [Ignavibacteriae bacterium]|nr:flagellar motor switch protein FliM [Ignavibacteriota bacterium]
MPHRLSKRQLQTFHAIHEMFAESLSSHLVARLQTSVTMSVVSVDQMFYSEYTLSTAKPSCLYVFGIGEMNARAVMEMSPQLVLAIISRMLGGTSSGEERPRPITKIEQNIIKGVVVRILSDLEKAWTTIIDEKFVLERFETEGDFMQIAPTSEIVLVISLEVAIADHKYLMNLCFPTFVLEDVLAKLNTQNVGMARSGEQPNWSPTILKGLESTTLTATCLLGQSKLTLQQLMELEPGDVLMTETPIAGELSVLIGEKKRAFGRPGISNGKKSVKITQVIETENE